jgi:hypothetical protein
MNRADVLSILGDEQQRSRQETLSRNFDVQFVAATVLAQISAALPVREQARRTVAKPDNKPVDAL